eukprot:scaffold20982_cov70-Cyclotella_meneghiniana.AAC.4
MALILCELAECKRWERNNGLEFEFKKKYLSVSTTILEVPRYSITHIQSQQTTPSPQPVKIKAKLAAAPQSCMMKNHKMVAHQPSNCA